MSEIANIITTIDSLKASIEAGYATKGEMVKHAEAVQALLKSQEKHLLKNEKTRIFGTKAAAVDFIDCLKMAYARSNRALGESSPLYMSKADLDVTTGSGAIPTATSSVLSMLLEQGGVNRKYAKVYTGIQGDINLPKRNGNGTAVFTAADDSAVTDDVHGMTKVTLSPKQISALAFVSDKLLYVSAINIAENVAIDLIEMAAKLEDESLVRGDGTAAFGSVTGLETAVGLGEVEVAVAALDLPNDILRLIPQTHEEVQSSGRGKFFMSAAAFDGLRRKKGTANDHYIFDLTTGGFKLAGYDIVIWHRLDNSVAAGAIPVLFGDMEKAVVVGVGRDMSLMVDTSHRFNSNQTSFRLTYDWQAQVIQPSAMARLSITA